MNNTSESQIEQRIIEAGKTAPRLTPNLIDSCLIGEDYHVFPGTTLTVCCLTLKNGFKTVGYSTAVSSANFDPQIGKDLAKKQARDKVWELEGYLLKQKLFDITS